MADLRAKNGYRQPWGVKYWELDNETYRWFTPDEYAKAAVIYARAMKAVDPSIRIGMVTYGRFRPHVAALLEAAGRDIDFLADRTDAEDGLDTILGTHARLQRSAAAAACSMPTPSGCRAGHVRQASARTTPSSASAGPSYGTA